MNQARKKTFVDRIKSLLLFFVKIIIAASIIGWLISSHYNDFMRALSNIEFSWLLVAVVLYLSTMVASALRWHLLLKIQNINITFFESLSLTMQGIFFSLVIPGGSLGGDLIKTGFIVSRTPRGNRLAVTSTVFMDRFLGMFGQFALAIVMGFMYIPEIRSMSVLGRDTVVVIWFASVAGILAGVAIMTHRQLEKIKPYTFFIKIFDRLSHGMITKLTDILDIYNSSKKTMFYCVLIGAIFVQLNMSLILYFIARGIHSAVMPIKALIFSIALGNTAALLPITPSGVGTRDFIVKEILVAGGFSHGDALAIPLLFTILMIFTSLIGGFFFVFHKIRKKIE